MSRAKEETWRVFCALELSAAVRDQVAEHIARLRAAVAGAPASWSRAENVHLTLKFLGEIPMSRVPDVSAAADRAVATTSTFPIEIGDTGAFPAHGRPLVLWIGVGDPTFRLSELHARLDDECLRFGFAKEARSFNPHLTIARLRKPESARALALAHQALPFLPVTVEVKELTVIRSQLSSEGSKYSVVSRHPLLKASL